MLWRTVQVTNERLRSCSHASDLLNPEGRDTLNKYSYFICNHLHPLMKRFIIQLIESWFPFGFFL